MWADPFEDTVRDATSLVRGLVEFNLSENPAEYRKPDYEEFRLMVARVILAAFAELDTLSEPSMPDSRSPDELAQEILGFALVHKSYAEMIEGLRS